MTATATITPALAVPPKHSSLPQALVIGAPKAGTTTLCATLMRHPDIWMYPRKETHFFNEHYETRGMAWYQGLFQDAPTGALIMEGTPDYAMSNYVDRSMARIAAHMPDARLIFIARNPVDRIESHYVQMVSNWRTEITLEEALVRWPEIVASSDYPRILDTVHEHFRPEQVLVLFFDDYIADRASTHRRVLQFLGLPDPDPTVLAQLASQDVLHRREDQAMDGALMAWMRRSPYFDRLNMAMPASIIRLSKRLLRRKINVLSTLAPSDRQRLTAQFAQGWEAFQRKYRIP
jgi:hypothetical protein